MGCLLGGCMVGLTRCTSQVCCSQSLGPWGRPLLTCAFAGSRSGSVSCGVPGFWCAQGFIWAFRASLVSMGFDSKCNFTSPTFFLGLLLCPWTWAIFFGGIKHSPVNGYSAVSCNFGVLPGEDERMCLYSAILVPPSLGSQILFLALAPLNYSVPLWQCGVKLQMLLDPLYASTCLSECKVPTINCTLWSCLLCFQPQDCSHFKWWYDPITLLPNL